MSRTLIVGSLVVVLLGCETDPNQPEPGPSQPWPGTSQLRGVDTRADIPVGQGAPTAPSLKEWRDVMVTMPAPKNGCFRASHPDSFWTEVPCETGGPLIPAAVGDTNGDDVALPSAPITKAKGTFLTETGVNFEYDTVLFKDSFSLQLNTNRSIPTSLCTANSPPSCRGWMQFVYANNDDGHGHSTLFVESWLINYDTSSNTLPCPSPAWQKLQAGAFYNCVIDSPKATGPATVTAEDLTMLTLAGEIVGGVDKAVLIYGGSVYVDQQNTVLNPGQGWTTAEFNVFGFGNNSEAVFTDSGTALVVETTVDDGIQASPQWLNSSSTHETNNLTLVPGSECPIAGVPGGQYPALIFMETLGGTGTPPFCMPDQTMASIQGLL